MPAPTLPGSKGSSTRHDMSVILVTGSYDHEIRFWEAWSGICSRTIARTGESGVSIKLLIG
jgi:G protein beta subunit-like protein